MRLTELVESKTVLKEAAPIILPIIGAVSPQTAALIASALGLGAFYTSDQLSKIKVDFPDAFENFNNTINNTQFKALAGNPFIATMLLTQQLINNPEKFNDKNAVNDLAKSVGAESSEINVSARPEVTANGGHTKRNQINAQRAWDAAYGQTHFHTGEVNPDAGKIDPALVKANIMAQPDYYDPRGKDQRATPASAKSPDAMTLSPEVRSTVDQAADEMSAQIAAGEDPAVIAKNFVSTLKSEISPEDVPDISAAPTVGPAATDAPAPPSFSKGDEVSYTSRRNPDGATATFVQNLDNGMVQLQRDGATFAIDPVNIDTTPPAAPAKSPSAQTSAPTMTPNTSIDAAPSAPEKDTSISRSTSQTLDVPKDDTLNPPVAQAPSAQIKAPDQPLAPDLIGDMPTDAMPTRKTDKPISKAAQLPLTAPTGIKQPAIGLNPPKDTTSDAPIAGLPDVAKGQDATSTDATSASQALKKAAAAAGIAGAAATNQNLNRNRGGKRGGKKRRLRLPIGLPKLPGIKEPNATAMRFSPIKLADPLKLNR